jgi:predicted XRE-type DNA-binding protein
MKKYKKISDLAVSLGVTNERGQLSELKSRLTKEIIKSISLNELTHQELAGLSGVPRSAITGIVNGSLQKVTLDRLLRILFSLGLKIEVKIKTAA